VESKIIPLSLLKWIEENRSYLKPPVGNKLIWEDREFMVFIVGGPNARTDYHLNCGEEFFYQIEGDVTIRIQEAGKPKDLVLKQGDILLLPPKVPHSPMRGPDTVGMVIERKRRTGVAGLEDELDGLAWYCPDCNHKLYQENFPLKNIVTDFLPVFDRFYSSEKNRTCEKCGAQIPPRK
jgi:3-hydroxyanthranilate 3,4-dioxygenase